MKNNKFVLIVEILQVLKLKKVIMQFLMVYVMAKVIGKPTPQTNEVIDSIKSINEKIEEYLKQLDELEITDEFKNKLSDNLKSVVKLIEEVIKTVSLYDVLPTDKIVDLVAEKIPEEERDKFFKEVAEAAAAAAGNKEHK